MEKLVNSFTRLLEIVPFLCILGSICVLIGAFGRLTVGAFSIPLIESFYRNALMTIGMISIMLGLLYQPRGPRLPSAKKSRVTLEYPSNTDIVDRTDIGGNFLLIPEGYTLRVLRCTDSGDFSPMPGALVINKKSRTWRMANVDVGGLPGEKRIVKICLAGPDSEALLLHHLLCHEVFHRVLESSRAAVTHRKDILPGLPYFTRMPSDLIVCGEVTVIKKPSQSEQRLDYFQDARSEITSGKATT